MSGAVVPFLAAVLYTSISLAAAATKLPRWIPAPFWGRFWFGFSLSPFFLGMAFLLSAWVWPGGHRWFHLGFPLAVCAVFLATCWRPPVGRLVKGWRLLNRSAVRGWVLSLCLIMLTYPATKVFDHMIDDTRAPILAFDALQYMRQAQPFAASADLDLLVDHQGDQDGTLRGDLHHPAWPAYLAYALMFTPDQAVDANLDHAAGAAIQFCFILMFSALLALMIALKVPVGWPVAVALVLLVPQFDYVVNSFSRDAYRTIPMLLCAAVLFRTHPSGFRIYRPFLTLGVLCGLTLVGHTLGGFMVVALGMAWAMGFLRNGGKVSGVAMVAAVMIAGLCAGGAHHAEALLESGSLTGGALADDALRGTVYEARMQQIWSAGLVDTPDITSRIRDLVMRDGLGISLVGLGLSILIAAAAVVIRFARSWQALLFLALPVLMLFVQFIGLIDWFGYRVSDWFITNKRYVLHWNVATAAFLGFLVARCAMWLAERSEALGAGLLLLVSTASSVAAGHLVDSQWYRNTWLRDYPYETLKNVMTASAGVGSNERLLLEDARWNWYLGNRHVLLYSRPTASLFKTSNCDELEGKLAGLQIGAVVLSKSSLETLWQNSTMFACLNGEAFERFAEADPTFAIFLHRSGAR
jgi:hypothetical protein